MTKTSHVHQADIDLPLLVRVTYDYTAGAPEEGPSYSSGGTPASPGEIDNCVVDLIIAGRPYRVSKTDILAGLIVQACDEDMHYTAEME